MLSFSISIPFFHLENPFFINAGPALDAVSILKCFQASMATSRISSLVMMQPLKSFKPCCLKWSFCWILTPEGLWNFSAGMDYLIRLQRPALLCLCHVQFASYCCGWLESFSSPGCSLVRIVSSITPGSVSLVYGVTHDKSVAYVFSTPQARYQQQTEILIHLLKKLALVNGIRGVLYLVDPVYIFSPRIWKELQF